MFPSAIFLTSRGVCEEEEEDVQPVVKRWKERMTGSPAAVDSWDGIHGRGGVGRGCALELEDGVTSGFPH